MTLAGRSIGVRPLDLKVPETARAGRFHRAIVGHARLTHILDVAHLSFDGFSRLGVAIVSGRHFDAGALLAGFVDDALDKGVELVELKRGAGWVGVFACGFDGGVPLASAHVDILHIGQRSGAAVSPR